MQQVNSRKPKLLKQCIFAKKCVLALTICIYRYPFEQVTRHSSAKYLSENYTTNNVCQFDLVFLKKSES